MRTFHVQILFQVAIENYLIHQAANNISLTKLTQFKSATSEKGTSTNKKKQVFILWKNGSKQIKAKSFYEWTGITNQQAQIINWPRSLMIMYRIK